MLVLSRGRNEKIVFPTLGIRIEVLRVAGKNVKLGVDAPKDIPVLRHELVEHEKGVVDDCATIKLPTVADPQSRLAHSIRNRLNSAALGLHCLSRMLENNQPADAHPTILKVFNELKAIDNELSGQSSPEAGEETSICDNLDYRGVRLFAMTAAKPDEMKVPIGPNGMDRWFSKPVKPQQLMTAIREDLHNEFIST